MRSTIIQAWFLGGMVCLSGCHGVRNAIVGQHTYGPERPANVLKLPAEAESPFIAAVVADEAVDRLAGISDPHAFASLASEKNAAQTHPASTAVTANFADLWPRRTGFARRGPVPTSQNRPQQKVNCSSSPALESPPTLVVRPVGHEEATNVPKSGGTITIDGHSYEIRLVDQSANRSSPTRQVRVASQQTSLPEPPYERNSVITGLPDQHVVPNEIPAPDAMLLNLPSALSMVGPDHPAVGFAQWKIQEAYANLEQAEVLWLPSIQAGFSFHRHDGNYQASNGNIVDVNRSSFQYGLGAGATGAGTTPVPGIRAQFHLAEAIFQPDIARKTAWATCHAEKAVVNRQLRDVALAYMKLLGAHQQLRILDEVRENTASLTKITEDFAAAGQGLQADADRMQTEQNLIEARILAAREETDVASARLAYVLSTEPGRKIHPMDMTVVPIELVSPQMDQHELMISGLSNRPELKELQALVAAACDRFEQQKYSPFVPSVLLGLSAGGFGGDTGNSINSVDDRYDFDAMVTWEIRNLGFGERSARRRSEAQVQQAMFRKLRLIDDVAREIAEASTQVTHRRERIAVTQVSIQSALNSYERNLSRIRAGQGLPIEVLQSIKALEASKRAYLDAVMAYNESQFQLQWAVGNSQ